MTDKKLEKLKKILGKDTIDAFNVSSVQELDVAIVNANGAMSQVLEELEANPNYVQAKEDLKELSAGKRDVDKRQKAIIAYCLYLKQSKGS